jgi:hypothetical protein
VAGGDVVIGSWLGALATEVPELDPEKVTPGMGGFLVFFALGIASWLLYRSLTTHMRRVDVRSRREAEQTSAPEETSGAAGGSER